MKKLILAVALVGIIAVPALCDEDEHEEMDLDEQMERIEFNVRSQMAELEVQKARLEIERMEREIEAQFACDDDDDDEEEEILEAIVAHGHVLGAICAIIHILAAVWVYGDMKGRPCASWIWIALVLLAGLCAMIAYGIIRMGDAAEGIKKK